MNMSGAVKLNRIPPAGPAHAYKTYGWSMPIATHWRPATCEEVGCQAHANGWVTTVDLAADLGKKQYEFCKGDRTRSFTTQRPSLTVLKLVYPPGNRCFRSGDHRLPLGRPARFYVAGGDYRGNPRGIPPLVHKRPQDWAEDFAGHQDRLKTAIQKG